MIKRTTIDQIFDTARVEEVIGDFVQLKKSGSSYKALSPFTDERTPSFMVSPVKQIWKDFSSGKGGNVVSFLMEHEHFTYPEALRYLAKKYGIEIEETEQSDEEKKQASEQESMYLVSEFAKEYFQKQLLNTEKGKAIGGTYFKERGFTPETIDEFDLGYSPDIWEAFTKKALAEGYQLDYLEKTGLTVVKNSDGSKKRQFDRFKGRVMFPIHSMSGRVLGFGGRTLSNHKKTAKYLNSPESPIYHKSRILYGIYQAKQTIAKTDLCYLMEGYTDVIQFHQNGVRNAVSSSGTALTEQQIRLIRRLTKNVVVLYDGDAAGTRASLRGIDLILEQGMNVKICAFPQGEDPDSFAKAHSEEEIKSYLEKNAMDFINYKASLLVDEAAKDPIKKAAVVRDMMRSVAKIPDDIQQELYLKECERIMDVSEETLYSTLAQIKAKAESNHQRSKRIKSQNQNFEVVKKHQETRLKIDPQYEIERHLISILLNYGDKTGEFDDYILTADEEGELTLEGEVKEGKVYEKIFLDLQEDEIEFTNEHFKALYTKIITEYHEKQELRVEDFINKIDASLATEITDILMRSERYKLHRWHTQGIYPKDKSKLDERDVQQTILNLRVHLIKQKVAELNEGMLENRAAQHSDVLREIQDYKKLQVTIANKLGLVIKHNTSS